MILYRKIFIEEAIKDFFVEYTLGNCYMMHYSIGTRHHGDLFVQLSTITN